MVAVGAMAVAKEAVAMVAAKGEVDMAVAKEDMEVGRGTTITRISIASESDQQVG